MNARASLTVEICNLVSKRQETTEKVSNDKMEKEKVRQTLNKKDHESIFGCTSTETVISERSSAHPSSSSMVFSKQADAEAELVVKLEQTRPYGKSKLNKQKWGNWKVNGNRVKQQCWQK